MRRVVVVVAVALVVIMLGVHGQGVVAQESLSITGTIWEDRNVDGVRQPDEPGMSRGINVLLLPETGEEVLLSTTPDADGRYSLEASVAGTYLVRLDVSHAVLTFPVKANLPPFEALVDLSETADAVDFGLHRMLHYPSFAGLAWVNGQPVNYADVRAIIDGVDCTGPGGRPVSGLHPAWYHITVVPSSIKTGCGSYGKTIEFTINGFLANETRPWQESQEGPPDTVVLHEMPDLTAGPRSAYFDMAVFDANEVQTRAPGNVLVAYVDGKQCGVAQDAGAFSVLLVVPSEVSVGGCGYDGAEITFTFNDVPIMQRGIWREGRAGTLFIPYRPGTRPRASQSELPPQILPPSVGDAGLR
jgi:hypothetical protein